jgi:transposase-like protein
MQKQKRKQYTADFKAKIVKEILREEKTASQLSAEYGIHSSQLYKWRDHALANLPGLFDDQSEKAQAEKEAEWEKEREALYAEIGRLTTEKLWLEKKSRTVNKKTVARYMQEMGLMAIFPGPNLSKRVHQAGIFPYLLRNLKAETSDHIWGIDITYIRLRGGWMYLVAVLDWYSRYIVSWERDSKHATNICVDSDAKCFETSHTTDLQ